VPDAPLLDGAHRVVWPGLRGVGPGAGVGRGSTIDFVVSGTDATPPRFDGLTGIEWDLARDRDPCLDRLEDRFVFRLKLGAASDDAGASLLSVLVFETRDPAAPDQAEPSRVALRPYPAKGMLELRRPADAAGKTCFAAVTQDLVGSVSGGGEREVCIATKEPPFFEGCGVASRSDGPTRPASTLGLYAGLMLWLRRRGRSAQRPVTA
jgi:hypothetical protein